MTSAATSSAPASDSKNNSTIERNDQQQQNVLAVFQQSQQAIPVRQKPFPVVGAEFHGRDSALRIHARRAAMMQLRLENSGDFVAGQPDAPGQIGIVGINEIFRVEHAELVENIGANQIRAAAGDENFARVGWQSPTDWAGRKCRSRKIRNPDTNCPDNSTRAAWRRPRRVFPFRRSSFSMQSGSSHVSLFRNKSHLPFAARAPELLPSQKPRFSELRTMTALGKSANHFRATATESSDELLSTMTVSIWPMMVCALSDSKHFGSHIAPLQFSTTMLTSGWPLALPNRSICGWRHFKVCFGFRFATNFLSCRRVL